MNKGQVYLICFHEKYYHAKHYIGFARNGVDKRIERHRKGQGARLLRALVLAGIGFDVVRVWDDVDRHFERKLKKRKNAKHFCPNCGGKL